jgi:aryl-alcohol dehydrogenase-like predicted oxidoreductase
MDKVKLGRTGIEVSKLGFGTGTAHPSGYCSQALMDKKEMAELLLYAFERGVNFWDTAFQYGTHGHIKEALRHVRRQDVVIATKLVSSHGEETNKMFSTSLKELGVDYVDVCLMHGVRTKRELLYRREAFNVLLKYKKAGKLRAVGLSSHGLSALKAAAEVPEIDVVWARINLAGLCMDAARLGLYDKLASISWLKKLANELLPKSLTAALRPKIDADSVSGENRKEVEETLKVIHSQTKGVVGMKVLAEGYLGGKAHESIGYVRNLPFIDSLVIGMLNRDEITENCRSLES